MTKFIFVDTESVGISPYYGTMTEFGAVELMTEQSFHGEIIKSVPSKENPAIPEVVEPFTEPQYRVQLHIIMSDFELWLRSFDDDRLVFVSDNPAWDYMWIAYAFDVYSGINPFGHSARRIGDLYAGLSGNWRNTHKWKKLRITKHDHNPVNDALGNVEAFKAILKQYGQELPNE